MSQPTNADVAADELLARAVVEAAKQLSASPQQFRDLREKDLSATIAETLRALAPSEVVERRSVKLDHFPNVGGADVTLYDAAGNVWCLAELKWSVGSRDKIFEAAWDAVKLALAREQHQLASGWLVTGASEASWAATECADLFRDGEVDVRELWDRPLIPPGPNGGMTVGDDLEIGARGLMFEAAPTQLTVRSIVAQPMKRGDESGNSVGSPWPDKERLRPLFADSTP